MNIPKMLFICLFIFAYGLSSALARKGVEIQYTPVKILKSNNNVFPLEISVSNFTAIPVREVQVWYRWTGEARFHMHPMENEGFNYYASLDISDWNTFLQLPIWIIPPKPILPIPRRNGS
jgi:hypothetical protein